MAATTCPRHNASRWRDIMHEDFTRLAQVGHLVCLVRFPGYAVSTDGRVWSCRRKIRPGQKTQPMIEDWQEVQPGRLRTGHRVLHALKRTTLVSRLILEAFIGPCPEGLEACHRNDDPTDDRLENLRWDTHRSKMRDMVRNGHHGGATRPGEDHRKAKLTESDVREIFALHAKGVSNLEIAAMKRVSPPNVCNILKRRSWKHLDLKSP